MQLGVKGFIVIVVKSLLLTAIIMIPVVILYFRLQ